VLLIHHAGRGGTLLRSGMGRVCGISLAGGRHGSCLPKHGHDTGWTRTLDLLHSAACTRFSGHHASLLVSSSTVRYWR
jgi:hypothetical protein